MDDFKQKHEIVSIVDAVCDDCGDEIAEEFWKNKETGNVIDSAISKYAFYDRNGYVTCPSCTDGRR